LELFHYTTNRRESPAAGKNVLDNYRDPEPQYCEETVFLLIAMAQKWLTLAGLRDLV
jgi:hypothetical protein